MPKTKFNPKFFRDKKSPKGYVRILFTLPTEVIIFDSCYWLLETQFVDEAEFHSFNDISVEIYIYIFYFFLVDTKYM